MEFFWVFLLMMVGAAAAARLAPFVPSRARVPLTLVVLLGFLCWAPFALSGFRTLQLSGIAVWVIVVMGLNILTGYNGQISLGHGALVALGAYVSAILMDGTEQMAFVDATPWPFWLTMIVAGLFTALVGLALGIPALRLSGPYLAIATLALAISFPSVMRKYDGFTGGTQGIRAGQPQPPALFDFLDRDQWLYFVALITAVLMLILAWSILRGALGRAFVAVRDSEVAAEAMGINVERTKVTAFTVSAFFAGVAGGLYTQVFGFISPNAIGIFQSISLLAAVVIGGLASILGSVVGGAAFVFLPSDAPDLVGRLPGLDVEIVRRAPGAIQGGIVIATILMLPAGVAGFLSRLEHVRPEGMLAAVRSAPGRFQARAGGLADQFSWAWDIRPRFMRGGKGGDEDEDKGG